VLADGDFLTLISHTWAVIGLTAGAAAAVGAVLIGVWQVIVSILNERRRTQPVVVAHDAGGRLFGDPGNPNTIVPTYLTNEGGGNAFNVRFGIKFDGVRYAWKFEESEALWPEGGRRSRSRRPVGEWCRRIAGPKGVRLRGRAARRRRGLRVWCTRHC
jgi:hypothetical protein